MRKRKLIETIDQLSTRLSEVEDKVKSFEFLMENKDGYKLAYSLKSTMPEIIYKVDSQNNATLNSVVSLEMYFYYVSPIKHTVEKIKLRTDYFDYPLTIVPEIDANINKTSDFTYLVKVGETYYSINIKNGEVREIHSEDIDNIFSI